MPTYLSRPVFDFQVDWGQLPEQQFTYDLRELQIAFAGPRYEQLQSHTVQGYSFQVHLKGEAAIAAWDAFSAQVAGRLTGFWLPAPLRVMEIEHSDPAFVTLFRIRDQGLRDYFQDHPSTHLALTKPGQAPQYRQIKAASDGVTLTPDGRELVKLQTPLATVVDPTWKVVTLLYVHFASDQEEAECVAENWQIRTLKVLELPEEYAATETGRRPVFLYEFRTSLIGQSQVWRETGCNQNVTSLGQVFTSFPIGHRDFRRSMRADREELTLEAYLDSACPLSLFVPFKAPASLWVTVYETTATDPDTRTQVFSGKVLSVSATGKALTARCSSLLDVMGRQFPAFLLQPRCNYFLFDQCCRIPSGRFTAVGTIDSIDGRRVVVNCSNPPIADRSDSGTFNYYAEGWLEVGSGTTFEVRYIRQSSALSGGKITLRIDEPLQFAAAPDAVLLRAGCNGSAEHCNVKFNNFRLWGGHVVVPSNNAMEPLEAESETAGKK